MADVPYRFVDSVVRVQGKSTTTLDEAGQPRRSTTVDDIQVELVQRAAEGEGSARTFRSGRGDQELGVQLTADGRLQSIEYKSVGVGAAVVTATAKVLTFVGSVAIAAARVGALAGQESKDDAEKKEDEKTHPSDPRQVWAHSHQDESALLETYRGLAKHAATRLAEVRGRVVDATELDAVHVLAAREHAVEDTLHEARAEIARIEALYAAWREGQRAVSSASVECLVDIERIPLRRGNAVPAVPVHGGSGYDLWTDFGVLLEVVDPRRSPPSNRRDVPPVDDDHEPHLVRWRIPRPIELWVWKRTPNGPALISRGPVRIADELSDTYGMEVRSSLFGEHGGTWTFNGDGSPSTLKTNDDSAVGAFADALASVPDTVVSSVEQAKKLTDALGSIHEAAAEREKAAAERDLATARARLELLGLNATADDFASLQRAEQAVKLRTATRAIAPTADAVDDLKQQLELVTTRNKLETERRSAAVEGDLAELKAEVARLEQEVKAAKARFDLEHPDH